MQIRTIPIDQLQPAPYNPRIALQPGSPEYRRLERSLQEFDLVQPVVWNERTGHVVGGHQRITVLKNQGVTELQAVIVDLPLEKEKALNITLNNSNVGSDWDAAKLVDLVAELCDLPDFDATLTGFDGEELNDLLMSPTPDFMPENDDETESDKVRVTLEIPLDDWDDVRPDLDAVIARLDLVAHVRMP